MEPIDKILSNVESFTGPNFITFAIPFFFLLIGVEIYYSEKKSKGLFRWNDSISDLSTGVLSQIFGIFFKVVSLFAYFYFFDQFGFLKGILTINNPVTWVVGIVGVDFCYYWYHRLSHEVNFFWAGHVIHHHSEEYNLIVALRQGSLGGLSSWIFYTPLAILGLDPWVWIASYQINLIYQFWVHTRVIHKMPRWFEFLFSTPSHHRAHHAINPIYIDKNHGGIFIIWDRMFGTFQEETEPCVYGTVKPLQSFNPLWANLHYYIEIFKTSMSAEKFGDKLKVWIKPPGWIPSQGQEGPKFHPIPEVAVEDFHKYDPNTSYYRVRYTRYWFVATLIVSFGWLLFYKKLGNMDLILSSLAIVWSLASIVGILESKVWAIYVEGLRCLFVASVIFEILGLTPALVLGSLILFGWIGFIRDDIKYPKQMNSSIS
jgi:sterol desaturase/sphingolipid hydroxylase (fatty acid hydroxylase superfamily)